VQPFHARYLLEAKHLTTVPGLGRRLLAEAYLRRRLSSMLEGISRRARAEPTLKALSDSPA